jgi:hypothetical protein
MATPSSTQHPITFPDIAAWKNNPRLVSGRSNKNVTTQNIIPPANAGVPLAVTSVAASTKSTTAGTQITLTHTVSPNDTAYSHTDVWATGYLGNTQPVKVSSGTSPHTFVLPSTGEGVSLSVQSIGKDGSILPLNQAPTTAVKLN